MALNISTSAVLPVGALWGKWALMLSSSMADGLPLRKATCLSEQYIAQKSQLRCRISQAGRPHDLDGWRWSPLLCAARTAFEESIYSRAGLPRPSEYVV